MLFAPVWRQKFNNTKWIFNFRNRSLLRNLRRTRRQKLKLARLRRRLRRKQQRRSKGTKKYKDGLCSPDERLNCFSHNNEHWKTPPFWTDGNFCACTNSNTNTYSCVRNVNGTHNYLYCEFVSGTITYYNLKVDPYQLRNIYLTLSPEELNFMHRQLAVLKNQGVQHQKRHEQFSRQRSFIQRYGNNFEHSWGFRILMIFSLFFRPIFATVGSLRPNEILDCYSFSIWCFFAPCF